MGDVQAASQDDADAPPMGPEAASRLSAAAARLVQASIDFQLVDPPASLESPVTAARGTEAGGEGGGGSEGGGPVFGLVEHFAVYRLCLSTPHTTVSAAHGKAGGVAYSGWVERVRVPPPPTD